MRVLVVVVSALFLGNLTACTASTPAPPQTPGLTYGQADFNPPSDFEMSFAPEGVAEGPAIRRSQPGEGSYRPRLVSLEKTGPEVAR